MSEREEGPEGITGASIREKLLWAANMAQRRWEKSSESPDFRPTKVEPRTETGLCHARISGMLAFGRDIQGFA
jgi:hypothetical protein